MESRAQIARPLGFTLIELMVTLAVFATLALVVTPVAQMQVSRVKEAALRVSLVQIRDALDQYRTLSQTGKIPPAESSPSGYPTSLSKLVFVVGVDGQPIRLLRKLPADPFADDEFAEAASTWDLVPFEPSTDPKQTASFAIYDVSSKSNRVALNGLPVKKW